MHSGNKGARFSYADDIGILGIGKNIAESATVLQLEIDNLMSWAINNAVLFNLKKIEIIQFNGRHREDSVNVRIGNTLVEPAEHIPWLGIYFNHRLSFRKHVKVWCAKYSV